MPEPLQVNDQISIRADELRFTYSRSSGPGGQNVNKVNTKATLRWAATDSPSLPPAVRRRFCQRYAARINEAGELILQCDSHREQPRNTAECLSRLRAMLLSVARAPKPRRKTKPTAAARERRLEAKRQRAQTKVQRGKPPLDG